MKQNLIKKTLISIAFCATSNIAIADLKTECSVIDNNDSSRITAQASFTTPISGDLYLAAEVKGQLLFFINGGSQTSLIPAPYTENSDYSGQFSLFDFPATNVEPGQYRLFKVVTQPGTDPLNFTNWVGGLAGLSSINFTIGMPQTIHGDFNNDCFADDDRDRDGFRDDDRDRDGFHDDDRDRDGFHDDDRDRDGFHDDDRDRDGFHDDDDDRDGFHDDDDDRDGFHDDDRDRDGFHDDDRDGHDDDDRDGHDDDDRDGHDDDDRDGSHHSDNR